MSRLYTWARVAGSSHREISGQARREWSLTETPEAMKTRVAWTWTPIVSVRDVVILPPYGGTPLVIALLSTKFGRVRFEEEAKIPPTVMAILVASCITPVAPCSTSKVSPPTAPGTGKSACPAASHTGPPLILDTIPGGKTNDP
uniref:Uncharacterized protein n=1 Tax=Compsopogon caeruleus TaxID=31354 RepID=A0A7S1XFD7_9RHOD